MPSTVPALACDPRTSRKIASSTTGSRVNDRREAEGPVCLNISGDFATQDSSGCYRQTLTFDARLQLLSGNLPDRPTKRRHMVMPAIGNVQSSHSSQAAKIGFWSTISHIIGRARFLHWPSTSFRCAAAIFPESEPNRTRQGRRGNGAHDPEATRGLKFLQRKLIIDPHFTDPTFLL